MWEIEYTDEFGKWWDMLSEKEQIDVAVSVELLSELGPHLPFPYASAINNSKYSHMRELRIQHKGKPYRILYAFDPRRIAILLIGSNKSGNKNWYKKFVPIADKLYQAHLISLKKEGKL
jgi:hypothetical protein